MPRPLPIAALILCLALALGLAACAPSPAPQPRPQVTAPRTDPVREANVLLELGEERLDQGRTAEAGDAFRAALKVAPLETLRRQARWGLARSAAAAGDWQGALNYAQDVLTMEAAPEMAIEAELLAARAEIELQRWREASKRLVRLLSRPPRGLTTAEKGKVRSLQARVQAGRGDPAAAASTLMQQAREAGSPIPQGILDQLEQVARQARSAEIRPLLARAFDPELQGALRAALISALMREGRLEDAQAELSRLKASPAAARWQGRIGDLQTEVGQARDVKARAVGVVLPLSGRYSRFGRQVLAAVELGLGLFSGASHPPTLYIEDSRSDPAAAAEAVARLVQERKVMAIIGPLSASASLAAARRAQAMGVSLITLTQVEGITQAGEYVFQSFVSPAEQVDAVLDEVMGRRGRRRIAILAPKNRYGEGFTNLIAGGVAGRGGKVVRTITYPTDFTDFTPQVKDLVHLPPGNYRPGLPDSPQPRIDFDALYIPDGPERAAMLASQLAYFDVIDIDLMGTTLWHNPKLLEIGGRYLGRSVIPAAFDPDASDPQVRRFVNDYRQALGTPPNLLDAHAYDAAVLVRSLLDQANPPRTRSAFRADLAATAGVRGACGALSVGADRRIEKDISLFTVRRGRFAPLTGATWELESPDAPAAPLSSANPPVPGVAPRDPGLDGASAPGAGTGFPRLAPPLAAPLSPSREAPASTIAR